MSKDILLYENGSGGELSIANGDIETTEVIFQIVYICLFGGNVEAVTKGNEINGEIRNDYWANKLLYEATPSKQFNSLTEAVLNETALNGAGRIKIQRAIEFDLAALNNIAVFEVMVRLLSSSKVEMLIKLKQPVNQQDTTLQVIWNNASKEIITNIII